MLAWCTVTQSELVYKCQTEEEDGGDERFWWRSSVFSLYGEGKVRWSDVWSCGWVAPDESMYSSSGYIYSLSVCKSRISISCSVFCACGQDRGEKMNKSTERRINRSLQIVPLHTQKSLCFSDRQSTHWSWSSGRSSLWLERRGRHWIQHWRGYCHLKKNPHRKWSQLFL